MSTVSNSCCVAFITVQAPCKAFPEAHLVLYSVSADGQQLLQEPLPELKLLRQQYNTWSNDGIPVSLLPGRAVDLAGCVSSSSHVDMEVTVSKGDSDSFALILQPFSRAGVAGAAGAAISYCWKTNTLQVRPRHLLCWGAYGC